MAEVRDPVHQFIQLSDLELGVIDTPSFQRLRGIHQLSLGFLVWPGATHTRFEHALGTMELAGRAMDAAFRNSDQNLPCRTWAGGKNPIGRLQSSTLGSGPSCMT